jgi:hypothetical protein
LVALGEALCAQFPLPHCCNNPGCVELRGASELQLVGGKGCVCSRCRWVCSCCMWFCVPRCMCQRVLSSDQLFSTAMRLNTCEDCKVVALQHNRYAVCCCAVLA